MTLNGRNAVLRKKLFNGAHQQNLNEAKPMLSVAGCRSMILVSINVRYMQIFAGVPRGGDQTDSAVVEEHNFHR